MKLVEQLDGSYNVTFNPELFLLKDFRDLRDDRNDIELVYKEIAFVYFYADLRSDFQFETNPEKRKEDIKRMLGLGKDWEMDTYVNNCIMAYMYLSQTVSGRLLESAYLAVDKFTEQIKEIDLNERDKGGKPIWNQKQIMDTVKAIPELLQTVKQAEMEYLKNQEKESRLRGDKVKTLYEDGITKLMLNDID